MIDNSNKIIDILTKQIEVIFDEYDNEVPFHNIEFKFEKRQYSSTQSYVLYIDGVALSGYQMKMYKVQYLCRCGRHIKILLQKYMKKKNLCCTHCLQDRKFENSVHTKPYDFVKGRRIKTELPTISFDEMDDTFKKHYCDTHLSYDDFYKYLPKIYSINNIIITDDIRKNIKYIFADTCNNQLKFCSRVLIENKKISFKNIKLKCEHCGKIFQIHTFNILLQDVNDIMCRKCKFSNLTYPIQFYKNTKLTFQSKLEYNFLEKCELLNIDVLNGIEVPYFFKNKLRTYITDFYLPELKYMIELKGTNQFYREDLKTGKIYAKNNAAEEYASENGLKFKFVLDTEFDDFITTLKNERDSLNNCENN